MNRKVTDQGLTLIRKTFCISFILFVSFPFVQILPIGGYTQPYALLIACLVLPNAILSFFREAPVLQSLCLISFVLVGLMLFIFTCFPYENYQEYKYLTSYVGFPIVVISAFYFLKKDRWLIIKVLKFSVYVWIIVALIQLFYHRDFMTSVIGLPDEIAFDIAASGRGVMSLAPEPTHYGYQILMLGAALALLGAGWFPLLICAVQVILLAKSASALMALVLGLGVAVLVARKVSIGKAFTIVVFCFSILALLVLFGPQSRMIMLISGFMGDPIGILQQDYSLNLRLGGLFASFSHIIENFLIPQGLSHSTWLASVEHIKANNLWLVDISLNGPPTGIGIILYQAGILLLPSTIFILMSIFRSEVRGFKAVAVYTVPFIILGQYSISAPPFALIYALVITRRYKYQWSNQLGYFVKMVHHRKRPG